MTREHGHLANHKSVAIDRKSVSAYDATLIATDHDEVDYVSLADFSWLVVDTRNGVAGSHIVRA
jgi:UDP-N-acetyl-D-glucosamine dehydrogenase